MPITKPKLGLGPTREPKLFGAKHRGLRQHGGRTAILLLDIQDKGWVNHGR